MVGTDVAGGLTIYFHPEALPAFSEIAQKLPSTSFIPENLFPSISARHDVMDGTGKFNPRRSCPLFLCNHAKVISQRLTPSVCRATASLPTSKVRCSTPDNAQEP
jgi:hypothetical protein